MRYPDSESWGVAHLLSSAAAQWSTAINTDWSFVNESRDLLKLHTSRMPSTTAPDVCRFPPGAVLYIGNLLVECDGHDLRRARLV